MSGENLNELMDSIAEENFTAINTKTEMSDISDDVAAGVVISNPETQQPIISERSETPNNNHKGINLAVRIIATIAAVYLLYLTGGMLLILLSAFTGLMTENLIFVLPFTVILATLIIPPIWMTKKNKNNKLFTVWKIYAAILIVAVIALIIWLSTL